jgi:serine/threonine protein kinase
VLYLKNNKSLHNHIKPSHILLHSSLLPPKSCEEIYNDPIYKEKVSRASFEELGITCRLGYLDNLKYLPRGEFCEARIGHIEYSAPEKLYSESYTYTADLWSLGCLFYHMLVGFVPFLAAAEDDMGVVNRISKQFEKGFYFLPNSVQMSSPGLKIL